MKRVTVFSVLIAASFAHLLNDTMQSVIAALIPILEESMSLTYTQVGVIVFFFNMTASIMQPAVGIMSDKQPRPYLMPLGMLATLLGMLLIAYADHYAFILTAVVLVGLGSAIFHPEAAKVVYWSAGDRRGLAQSIFQVGGNAGSALAPLLSILVFAPFGQRGAVWFAIPAIIATGLLLYMANWHAKLLKEQALQPKSASTRKESELKLTRKQTQFAMTLLILFATARAWYHAGITIYYPLYLIEHEGITYEHTQWILFSFLFAGAIGTFLGGTLSDRLGRKNMMLLSMLGSAPLAVLLPYVPIMVAAVLCFIIGLILLSSFSVMVVYAQELLPGKVGTASGLILGLAFGLGAIGAAVLGKTADLAGLDFVMILCSFLPLLGCVAFLLPSDKGMREGWGRLRRQSE